LHTKKISNSPSIFFFYVKIIYFTYLTFTVTVLLRYSMYQYRRIMHNSVIQIEKTFKQPCQSFSTNSELLPASAYNRSIRSVLLIFTLTSSSAILRRLKARDCFFLGGICGVGHDQDLIICNNKFVFSSVFISFRLF
jgi:hypothetical protein